MNKQEAIERIESGAFTIEDTDLVVGLSYTKNIINQIDEPQKVTIPKFVAEWIEAAKETHNNLSWVWFSRPTEIKTQKWLNCNTEKFMRACLDGFEIEQEKLYRVEIADAILTKITRGRERNVKYRMLPYKDIYKVFNDGIYANFLTETEIKQADERLWQFAESVEEK